MNVAGFMSVFVEGEGEGEKEEDEEAERGPRECFGEEDDSGEGGAMTTEFEPLEFVESSTLDSTASSSA